MMRSNRVPWTTGGAIAVIVGVLAFWSTVIYVAVHFIRKYWQGKRKMAKVTGVLYKVYEKQWQNKVLRSFKLDGNPIYYRWGEKPVPAGVVPGAALIFEAEAKDDKSAQIKGDIIVSQVQSHQAVQNGGTAAAAKPQVDWAAKDDSIRYQSSRKDALAFLGLPGILEGLVGKAKPADKVGIVEAVLDKYTAGFFSDVSTFGAVVRANGNAEKESAKPVDEYSDDEE
jgi:hypothetical protein